MKVRNKNLFWIGVGWLIFLLISYFIRFESESGSNFVTYDRLLGVLILHNVYLFASYVLIGLVLVWFGVKKDLKID